MAIYRLDIKDSSGVLKAQVTNYLWVVCQKYVNRPGIIRAGLNGFDPAIQYLAHRSQVELWRADPVNNVDWHKFHSGLFMKPKYAMTDVTRYELDAPGDLSMLGWRIVAWPASVANRSKFTAVKAETIMKTLVSYNAGANATTGNGRIRTGTITGISVQSDGANGNTHDWYCHSDILLETLQKLALIGGGDFDLVKTGAAAWEFRWYTGQLGADRSATVRFAVELGNMAIPTYEYSQLEEKTVVIVGGPGTDSNRTYIVRTGPDYSASNDKEDFLNASGNETVDALNAAGDRKLQETRARESFQFNILQTPACTLDVHYFLGDKVSVKNPFTGGVSTQKVAGVTIGLSSEGAESVGIELSTP